MPLWWTCQLIVTTVHEASVNQACGTMSIQHTTPHQSAATARVVIEPTQSRIVVTSRQVSHQRPTDVDNRLDRVMVPFK